MGIVALLLLSLSVAVDAFAVSIAGSLCDRSENRWQKMMLAALFFGGFQFLMPLAGYGMAAVFSGIIREWDHYAALLLLLFVGGKMIVDACRNKEKDSDVCCGLERFFTPKRLLLPALATSLDALAVGASLRFAGVSVLFPAISMGIVTGVISAAGVFAGGHISRFAGEKSMTITGGCIIILIGIKIFLEDIGVL